jgi:hypothetical protein
VVEALESRRLFTAWTTAPTILQVTDGVAGGNSFSINGGGMDPSSVSVAIAPEVSAPVFEADFNGSGNGTGGSGNLVALGGTGALGTTTGVTNTVIGTSPFSANSGNYVHSAVASGSASNQTVATFTPTSAATSWDAITGTTTVGTTTYTTLNGGFDLLVRPDSTASGDTSWFRPIDISNISGTTGMRIILTGNSGAQLQLQVLTASGTDGLGSSAGSFTTNNSFALSGGLTDMSNPFVNGSITHIAVTFSTNNLTGQITMSVFAVSGTGAIDTASTANLLGSQSFYASASVIGATPLPTGAWSMTDRYSNAQATAIDYDTPRIFNFLPTTFAIGPAFEADLNGNGNGTGGSGNMVAVGGTGVVGTGTGVTNTITGANPFSTDAGNYLNSAVAAGSASNDTVATFTPTSAANSWNALAGTTTVGGTTYTTLNGGFDLFVRPDNTASTDISWFRPVDVSNISGSSGMRIILNGAGNQLQFQVLTGSTTGLGSSPGSFTTNSSFGLSGALTNVGNPFTDGQVEHVAITFSTNSATGQITIKVFAVAGTGAIDTTSTTDLLGSQSFYASAAAIGATPLPTGAWSISDRYYNAQATSVDYDSIRLYNTLQTAFSGIAPSAAPPANAVYPQILQRDTNEEIYVTAQMPAGLAPGVYDVWVENSYGWSTPVRMDAAEPTSISDYQAYAGIDIEVVGKNMNQSEFGGSIAPEVRLNDGNGHVVSQTVVSENPYDITFSASGTVGTTYYVEVSNDGGQTWSRLNDGQTLTIVAHTGTDPLGLGVSWAQDFDWSSEVSVATYGATGVGTADVTTDVQNAINAESTAGGGVVYFPNGTYYISGLGIPSNIVLEGQSEANTKIIYDNTTGGSTFIRSTGNASTTLQGIADLSISLSDPTDITLRPDVFINLGGPGSDEASRLESRLFVYGVNLSYPNTDGDSNPNDARRGIGLEFNANERVLIENNDFVGWEATMADTHTNQYCIVKNNTFDYSSGYVANTATYAFFEGNTVNCNSQNDQETHGLDGRSDAYFYDNTISNVGDAASDTYNDGEGIMCEGPDGNFDQGAVTSSTSTVLTVSPLEPLTVPDPTFGTLSVMITDGRGVGQLRTVVPGTGVNVSADTITVTEPFTITPDSSSQFTLLTPNENMTVYDNTLTNNAKGIWMYGNGFDDVAADNTLTNCRGILVYAVTDISDPGYHSSPNYFARITGNTLTGVSPRDGYGGISVTSGRSGPVGMTFVNIQDLGTDIIGNTITGSTTPPPGGSETEAPPFSGIAIVAAGFSRDEGTGGTGDITDTMIQNNTLKILTDGITLTGTDDGQMIFDNVYGASVSTFLQNQFGTSDNTIELDNVENPSI